MKDRDMEELERFREQKKKRVAYHNKYNKENYDRVNLMLPKGTRADLERAVELTGSKSIAAYIVECVRRDIAALDSSPAPAGETDTSYGYYAPRPTYGAGEEELPFS